MLGVFLETEIMKIRHLGTMFRNRKDNNPPCWEYFQKQKLLQFANQGLFFETESIMDLHFGTLFRNRKDIKTAIFNGLNFKETDRIKTQHFRVYLKKRKG